MAGFRIFYYIPQLLDLSWFDVVMNGNNLNQPPSPEVQNRCRSFAINPMVFDGCCELWPMAITPLAASQDAMQSAMLGDEME